MVQNGMCEKRDFKVRLKAKRHFIGLNDDSK